MSSIMFLLIHLDKIEADLSSFCLSFIRTRGNEMVFNTHFLLFTEVRGGEPLFKD